MTRWLDALIRRPVLLVGGFVVLATAAIVLQSGRSARTMQEQTALSAARAYARTIEAFRELYAEEVVPDARAEGLLSTDPTHDLDGKLPLPYALTIDLADMLDSKGTDGRFRVYSDFPWPAREKGGPHDAIERELLAHVTDTGSEYVVYRDTPDGRALVYGEPILLDAQCLDCHNGHAESPKRDWVAGDVRGVMMVEMPLPASVTFSADAGLDGVWGVVVVTAVTLLLLVFIVRRIAALEAGRRSDREVAAVVDSVGDAVLVIEVDGRVSQANPAAEQLFARPRASLLGLALEDLVEADTEFGRVPPGPKRVYALREDGTSIAATLVLTHLDGAEGKRVASLRDEAALREAEKRLVQAERWEAVGRLSGGIAHDFNNLLVVIQGNVELFLDRETPLDPADPQDREELEAVLGAARHGSALTSRLLSIGRRQALRPGVVVLAEYLPRAARLFGRTLGEAYEVRVSCEDPSLRLWIDVGQLEAALLNLTVNARDAMPEGGTLSLAARALDDETLVVEVTDSGTGIPQELLERVVEPFFTTKGEGRGTGLGLSMVEGFVSQCGGALGIESEPGRGTTVSLRLPRAPVDLDVPEPVVERRGDALPTPGVALIVEDEQSVRSVISHMFERMSFEVRTAWDAESVEEQLLTGATIDILVSDVVLGRGERGPRIAERVRAVLPHLPLIFVSGYVEEEVVDAMELDLSAVFLPKPFTMDQLREAIGLARSRAPQPEYPANGNANDDALGSDQDDEPVGSLPSA